MAWVYVIANSSVPNLVKVGCTDRDPQARAKELAATGVPGEYVVKFQLEVDNAFAVEKETHRLLGDAHHSKEWFRCSVSRAREAIESSADVPSSGSPLVPGHALEPYFSQAPAMRNAGSVSFVVEPEVRYPPVSTRPMFGNMNYVCKHCGHPSEVAAARVVRCSHCGKSEIVH